MEEEESAFFVLGVKSAANLEGADTSFEYSMVKIPADKIERAVWMQDGIDTIKSKILELKEQQEQKFGGAVKDEISKLETQTARMTMERNDYLGKNAISYLEVVERGLQTFFEGDGVGSKALEKMISQGVFEISQDKKMRTRA